MKERDEAQKMIQFNKTTQIATVYHIGIHTCNLRVGLERKKEIEK